MESYLDGELTVEQLGGDPAAGLFRGADARGSVAWLARGGTYQYLHVAEFAEAGVRRGFHLHANHTEHFYVSSARSGCSRARAENRWISNSPRATWSNAPLYFVNQSIN